MRSRWAQASGTEFIGRCNAADSAKAMKPTASRRLLEAPEPKRTEVSLLVRPFCCREDGSSSRRRLEATPASQTSRRETARRHFPRQASACRPGNFMQIARAPRSYARGGSRSARHLRPARLFQSTACGAEFRRPVPGRNPARRRHHRLGLRCRRPGSPRSLPHNGVPSRATAEPVRNSAPAPVASGRAGVRAKVPFHWQRGMVFTG